jgi:hypothetical protein
MMRPATSFLARSFPMRRAPSYAEKRGGYSTFTKALITCTAAGEAAYAAGARAHQNPYVSPQHNWAWREGWERASAAAKAARQAELAAIWAEGRLL